VLPSPWNLFLATTLIAAYSLTREHLVLSTKPDSLLNSWASDSSKKLHSLLTTNSS